MKQISMFELNRDKKIKVKIPLEEPFELNIRDILSLHIFYNLFGEIEYQIKFTKSFFIDTKFKEVTTIANLDYITFSQLLSHKNDFSFEIINDMKKTEYRKNKTPEFGFIRTTYGKKYIVPFSKIQRVFKKKKTDFRAGKNYKKEEMIFIEGDLLGRGIEKIRISDLEYQTLKKKGILDKISYSGRNILNQIEIAK